MLSASESADAVPSSAASLVGRTLAGRYHLEAVIGHGAMGHVYRACHVELGRTCAVKVLRPQLVTVDSGPYADPTTRLRAEARALSRLDHPNVLRVVDFGRDPEDGILFLVTEFIEGTDLVDLLGVQGPLGAARSVAIVRQICGALSHVHDRGIIHRDIKPENVRVGSDVRTGGHDSTEQRDRAWLLDFGAAVFESAEAKKTGREAFVTGTPAYMSPEQARGEPLDPRSDVYAVGVLLFELLTGRAPFERESPQAVATAHVESPPPLLRSIDPIIDPELERIVLACLRKRPDDRPGSARDLDDALAAIARSFEGRGLATTVPPPAPGEAAASFDDEGAEDDPLHKRVARLRPRSGPARVAFALALLGAGALVWLAIPPSPGAPVRHAARQPSSPLADMTTGDGEAELPAPPPAPPSPVAERARAGEPTPPELDAGTSRARSVPVPQARQQPARLASRPQPPILVRRARPAPTPAADPYDDDSPVPARPPPPPRRR